jgi:hypothetical protein
MNKRDELSAQNTKLNDINFRLSKKIKKLKHRLSYIQSIKTIWTVKDRIKEHEHTILINEQQVRFNLLVMIKG